MPPHPLYPSIHLFIHPPSLQYSSIPPPPLQLPSSSLSFVRLQVVVNGGGSHPSFLTTVVHDYSSSSPSSPFLAVFLPFSSWLIITHFVCSHVCIYTHVCSISRTMARTSPKCTSH
uniref:Uncharacterized protein n=1 Tax=Physcomitrium patens TaxID=3218 RepID=A0A2K1KBS6_PHYPA|nr:hypothetical protein PHYPA_010416 [Physcomitrium patens]